MQQKKRTVLNRLEFQLSSTINLTFSKSPIYPGPCFTNLQNDQVRPGNTWDSFKNTILLVKPA